MKSSALGWIVGAGALLTAVGLVLTRKPVLEGQPVFKIASGVGESGTTWVVTQVDSPRVPAGQSWFVVEAAPGTTFKSDVSGEQATAAGKVEVLIISLDASGKRQLLQALGKSSDLVARARADLEV